MKFLRPNPGQSIDLFRMLAQQEGYTFSDPESTEKFINQIREEFAKAKSSPIVLHGFRIQAMFEYVATSLGKCAIVKAEDAGGLHTSDPNIKIPDLRLLLTDGQEFFVEVKNFYQSSPFEVYKIKKDYKEKLQRYAALFKKDVKLAVYWTRWNQWTLISFDTIKCNGKKCSLSFEEAMKHNEMAMLGDFILATLYPLKFRVFTDPAHPRTVKENGEAIFRIGRLELYCGENRIDVPREQSIALFLMLYGEWGSSGGEAHIENKELIYFDFVSQPAQTNDKRTMNDEQIFETIGNMSGMVSRRFNTMTANKGEVERLSPQTDISDLGIQIPTDYQGEVLHLWRFILQQSAE
jgi:hypothetical protein